MPTDVARAALYRGRINLWVEDELSREYLSELWNDPDVAYFIGGGNDGVRAIIEDADHAGFRNVFGLTDRDFRPTNRDGWGSSTRTFRTFVLPVHEIENYLLVPEALAASRLNTLRRTPEQIEGYLTTAAGRLAWWAACREVVAELKRRFRDRFVGDPACSGIADETSAFEHICTSEWFVGLPGACAGTTQADVRQLLRQAHATAVGRLADGSWRHEFAGKEIFRDLGSRICDRSRVHPRGYRPTPAEFDTDLAKDVGAWQRSRDRIPEDLRALLAALKRRIAGAASGS